MSMAVLDEKTDTAARARPSLYAAIKLARLVLFMKERFKSRIKSRKQPNESLVTCHRDSFKALAFDEISLYGNFRLPTLILGRLLIASIYLARLELVPEAATLCSRNAIIQREQDLSLVYQREFIPLITVERRLTSHATGSSMILIRIPCPVMLL